MKHTIVTLDGIYTLDASGFYVPASEPDTGHYPLWLTIAIWTAGIVGSWAFLGAVYALGRAAISVFG